MRKSIAQQLKAHNLKFNEFEILYALKDRQSIQPSQIVDDLIHDPAAVSRILSNLNQYKYISYISDKGDRRRVFVQITDHGELLINSLIKKIGDEEITFN